MNTTEIKNIWKSKDVVTVAYYTKKDSDAKLVICRDVLKFKFSLMPDRTELKIQSSHYNTDVKTLDKMTADECVEYAEKVYKNPSEYLVKIDYENPFGMDIYGFPSRVYFKLGGGIDSNLYASFKGCEIEVDKNDAVDDMIKKVINEYMRDEMSLP